MGFEPDGLSSPHPGRSFLFERAALAGPQLTRWPIQGAVADDVEVEVEDGLA